MTVIRCHDIADRSERFGMARTLGRTLGFDDSDIIAGDDMYKVYRITADSAYNVTADFARRLADFNQREIQFYGDGKRIVHSVGIGTGCYSNPIDFMKYNADYYLAISDAVSTWIQTAYSNDSGLPLGIIHHGASEEAGMRELCAFLSSQGYDCSHINGGADYVSITDSIQE
jgi:hypothetical protein